MLEQLKLKLSARMLAAREEAFEQAHRYVDWTVANGGVAAPHRKSFPKGVRFGGARVDLEVNRGIAFVRST